MAGTSATSCSGISMFSVGANSCWRPGGFHLVPTRRSISFPRSAWERETEGAWGRGAKQSQRPEIHKPPGSSCKREPAKATVGRPFRVAIPGTCSDSCKAKALPYVLNR